jgi:hypothetical protein
VEIKMTKTEALEKALEFGRELMINNPSGSFEIEDHNSAYRVNHPGGPTVFPYTPPREAPPRGTIVEVWTQNELHSDSVLMYSLGMLDHNGRLLVVSNNNEMVDPEYIPRDGYANWRVVGEGERVSMFAFNEANDEWKYGWCRNCKSDMIDVRNEPCKTCTTTRPSNWEGGGE